MRNRLYKTTRDLARELGRDPYVYEIAEKMSYSVEKVQKILSMTKQPVSLETPIGEDDDGRLIDLIEDERTVSALDATINMNVVEQIRKLLSILTPREEMILRLRFGLKERGSVG